MNVTLVLSRKEANAFFIKIDRSRCDVSECRNKFLIAVNFSADSLFFEVVALQLISGVRANAIGAARNAACWAMHEGANM